MVSPLLERGYCLRFLFWGIPDDLIYPRSATAIIFRHLIFTQKNGVVECGRAVLE